MDTYKKTCYDLRRDIEHAKGQYRRKVEFYYTGSNAHRMWQVLQTITDYKGKPSHELPSDAELPNERNAFHAHFKEYNTVPCVKSSVFPDDCGRCEQKTFKQVNNHNVVLDNLAVRLIGLTTADLV